MGRRIFKTLDFIVNNFLDVIYPNEEECVVCGCYSPNNLCKKCEKNIDFLNSSFSISHKESTYKYYSIAAHEKSMRDIIIALKYKNNFNSANIIANYMKELIISKKFTVDAITFVPMSKSDERRRGFNQSKVIAKKLAKSLNKPHVNLLKKQKKTQDQIGLSPNERWININNSFTVKNNAKKYNSVVLIDDVITTGATVINCVDELKKYGIKKIYILTASKSIV